MGTIDTSKLVQALLVLFDEAYAEPADPNSTWFVDNEAKSGFLGSLEKLTAADASREMMDPEGATIAAHTNHLRYALELANRAYRGENPYDNADWKGSWLVRKVDEAQWRKLVSELRREYDQFRRAIAAGIDWEDDRILTGTLAQLAHGAWHLGALRQLLDLLK